MSSSDMVSITIKMFKIVVLCYAAPLIEILHAPCTHSACVQAGCVLLT